MKERRASVKAWDRDMSGVSESTKEACEPRVQIKETDRIGQLPYGLII